MSISPEAHLTPTWRWLLSHPAHFIAYGLGAGLSPAAPGTMGTLVAFPLYWLAQRALAGPALLVLIAVVFSIGVWASAYSARALGRGDPGGIVCDEIAAFMLVLYFTPPSALGWAAAFALFRAFDILKPFPIRQLERRVKGGLGIMLDDTLAALYAIALIKLAPGLVHG